jgi:hypothetical protein
MEADDDSESQSQIIDLPPEQSIEELESKALRTINITGVDPIISTEKGGTPNRSIARFLRQCVNLHDKFEEGEIIPSNILFSKRTKNKKKKYNLVTPEMVTIDNVLDLADEVENTPRGTLTRLQTGQITAIISKAIKSIQGRDKTEKSKLSDEVCFSQLWYSFLVKSISDVAQFGSVIRNSSLLLNNQSQDIPPCIAYLSSDLIAAAEATTLGRQVNHPYLILSTRKTANVTQQVILQKREITATALFLICMFDEESSYLNTIMSQYTSNNANNETSIERANKNASIITAVFKDMNETNKGLVDKFKAEFKITVLGILNVNYTGLYKKTDPFISQLQTWADIVINGVNDASSEKHFLKSSYFPFIQELHAYYYKYTSTDGTQNDHSFFDDENQDSILNIFQEMIIYGSQDNMFTIPRWIHQFSVDIHTARPGNEIIKLTDTEDTNISIAEIIAATEDAAYGHDFSSIQGVTLLGEAFMNKVLKQVDQLRDPVNIFNYIPLNYHGRGETSSKGSYEKKCIIDVLDRNKYVTITQQRDQYIVIFNPVKNFLTFDLEKLPLQDTVTKWRIGLSPLYPNVLTPPTLVSPKGTVKHRKIYMSIDYSKGTSSFYEHITSTKNAIRDYSRIEPNTYAFDFIINNDYEKLQEILNNESGFFEIMDVTTMFDGAAPIGAQPQPFKIVNAKGEEELVPHNNSIMIGNLFQLTMTTEANNKVTNDITEWITLQTSKGGVGKNVNALSKKLKDTIGGDNQNMNIVLNRDDSVYMYEFGLLVGMFFNSIYSNSEVIGECRSIASGISEAVKKEILPKEETRSKRVRKQTAQYLSEEDQYNQMITTTKNATISLIVSNLTHYSNPTTGQKEKIPEADEIITEIQQTISEADIFDVINTVFKGVLDFEKSTQTTDATKDGVSTFTEIYLNCMISLLSGALKVSSKNMTNGNFLSGETLVSSGVVRPEIIRDIDDQRSIIKSKKMVTSQTIHVRRNLPGMMRDRSNITTDSPPDWRISKPQNTDRAAWSGPNPRTNPMGQPVETTGDDSFSQPLPRIPSSANISPVKSTDGNPGADPQETYGKVAGIMDNYALGDLNQSQSSESASTSGSDAEIEPASPVIGTPVLEPEPASPIITTESENNPEPETPPETAPLLVPPPLPVAPAPPAPAPAPAAPAPAPAADSSALENESSSDDDWVFGSKKSPHKIQKTTNTFSGKTFGKKRRGGGNTSHKKNKKGKHVTHRRSTKSNKKAKSSRKGSRKARKERKKQRTTRRLNK